MTNKTTKGYTKRTMGKIDLMSMLKADIFKDHNESFEVWFNRKIEYQSKSIAGGMDERVTSRKGSDQSPKPLA